MVIKTLPILLCFSLPLALLSGCGEGKPNAANSGTPESLTGGAPASDLSAIDCVLQGEQAFKDGDRAGAIKFYDRAVQLTADNPPQMKIFEARRAEIQTAAK